MNQDQYTMLKIPRSFKPPIVTSKEQGAAAFHKYDWYFEWARQFMKDIDKVFLVPCAQTKPICDSSMHRSIYQKYIWGKAQGREDFVVSEPVVLIHYEDLYELEKYFLYDFPPKLLSPDVRAFFVRRLRELLTGKDIEGCLPRHHASLINDAIGTDWKNYWQGDMLDMMKKANQLR